MPRSFEAALDNEPCDMVANDPCPFVSSSWKGSSAQETADAKRLSQMMTNDPVIIKQLCGKRDPKWLKKNKIDVGENKHRLRIAFIRNNKDTDPDESDEDEFKDEIHLAWQNKPGGSVDKAREFQAKIYHANGAQASWVELKDSAWEWTDPLFDINLWIGASENNLKRLQLKTPHQAGEKYRPWILRAWRAFFPDDELTAPGAKPKKTKKTNDKTKKTKSITAPKKGKKRSAGEMATGEGDDQVGQSGSGTERSMTTAGDWWTEFDSQPERFDLESPDVVKKVRMGWAVEHIDDEAAAPPVEVLKAIQYECKKFGTMGVSAMSSDSYFEWSQSVSTGVAKGRTTFVEYPSMEEREQMDSEADQTSSKGIATTQAEAQGMSEDEEENRAFMKRVTGLDKPDSSQMDSYGIDDVDDSTPMSKLVPGWV